MMNRSPIPDPEQERIALQNEARRLELELHACQAELARLRSELENARLSHTDLVGEMVTGQQEALFRQIAAPVSQLLTQAHLVEMGGVNLAARDVLATARRLITALRNAGLTIEGQPGERATFDPDRHAPLSAAGAFETGQPVVIRFAGIGYQGKLLQRAGVETAEGVE